MKKLLGVITAAAVLLGSTIAYASTGEPIDEPIVEAYANTTDVDDQTALLNYYELEDGTLRVSQPEYTGGKLTNVVIPAVKDGKKVTQIGSFGYCRNLTSVTIPEGVTSIDWQAFEYCTSLTSVVIPESVTSIGNSAFSNCTSLTSITIPDSVTSMGIQVFYKCTSLTSVSLPNGITNIEDLTFGSCSNLSSIIIPDSVTTIGSNAFSDCTSLTEITLPKTVISLERNYITDRPVYDTNIFYGCTNLKSINVAEGNSVYYSLAGVLYAKYTDQRGVERHVLVWYPQGKEETNYTLPENIISIADGALDERSKLENIFVDPNNDYFESIDGVLFSSEGRRLEQYPAGRKQAQYTIPDGVRSMADSAFEKCNNLVSVTIPNDITNAIFGNCTGLRSIILPNGITEANFRGCTNLETINFPSSLKYMYFDYCSSLTSEVVIPENVRVFSFWDCKSLTAVMIPDSITEIDSNAFRGCENLTSLKMSKNVNKIGSMAFWGCKSLASIRIPNSITDIAYGAFGCCANLKSVNIPQSVKSIGDSAFQDCMSLTSVRIPDSVETIGYCAFLNAKGLKSVSISNRVKTIEYYTFDNCTNLEVVIIPSSVVKINGSFGNCQKLTDVYYSGTEEQWNKVSGLNGSSWNYYLENATIHYNSTGPDIVELPIEIELPKPADGAPETANMQVAVKQGNSIIDTLPINDDGTLDLSGVPDGDYTFTFSADNCAPRSYTVSISSGTVTGLEDGVELRLYGDIDDKGDGIVDIRDVAKANMYFKTGVGLSGYMLTVSDVNGDNVINIKDVALMNAHFKKTGNLWAE